VNAPGSVREKKRADLGCCIDAAGWFTYTADKCRATVRYGDGEVHTRHKFSFFRSDPNRARIGGHGVGEKPVESPELGDAGRGDREDHRQHGGDYFRREEAVSEHGGRSMRDRVCAALYPQLRRPDSFERLCRDAAAHANAVLDFGAGRGAGLRRVAPDSSLVVGVDVARDIEENQTVDARVVFDGDRLPFRDDSFGACTMRWVVEHLVEPEVTFREVARVMRRGGRLVILTPNLWFYAYLFARITPNWIHPWVVRRIAGRAERDTFPTYYRANTRRRLRSALVRAGFRERVLAGHQWGPGYLGFSLPTLLIGAAYERLVNKSSALSGLRQALIADFERA